MGQEEVDATKETENLGNELKDTADEAEKSGGKFKKFGGVLKEELEVAQWEPLLFLRVLSQLN